MTERRRLNQMNFCVCGHGQGAHRNGSGPCFGERMVGGVWWSCECLKFDLEPDRDLPEDAKW
jgi:hypothetical protein